VVRRRAITDSAPSHVPVSAYFQSSLQLKLKFVLCSLSWEYSTNSNAYFVYFGIQPGEERCMVFCSVQPNASIVTSRPKNQEIVLNVYFENGQDVTDVAACAQLCARSWFGRKRGFVADLSTRGVSHPDPSAPLLSLIVLKGRVWRGALHRRLCSATLW